MKSDPKDLPAVIETAMQVIIALRWAAQRGAALPEPLDLASQNLLRELYMWQWRRGETISPGGMNGTPDTGSLIGARGAEPGANEPSCRGAAAFGLDGNVFA